VTVLLAVRNGEPFLRAAAESVLAQTIGDLELLVVDDASDDGTPELLESIGDERLRVLRNAQNLGQVPSLNLGLHAARGRYVARLDHDDVCLPDRLERQVAVLDSQPRVAVVGSWATLVDASDAVVGHARQSIRDYLDFVYWNLVAWVLIPHPSAVFRRDVVLELGGYDESLGPSEDKDLWRRLALHRFEARIVEAELIRYRLHGTQLSRLHEERQRRNDALSHERFLAALSPDVDKEQLRLLLTADPALFADGVDTRRLLADLTRLLDGAASTLRLPPADRARLERLVRARVARAARDGWRGELPAWRRASPGLARYGLRRGGPAAAADAAAYVLALPVAPALAAAVRVARAAAHAAVASPRLRRLEAQARRSRLARLLYSRLLGRS
jgi:GT2 family glycosyltransferase